MWRNELAQALCALCGQAGCWTCYTSGFTMRLGSKKRRSTIVPPCILVLPLDWICSFAPFGLKAVQDQFLSGLRQENMWWDPQLVGLVSVCARPISPRLAATDHVEKRERLVVMRCFFAWRSDLDLKVGLSDLEHGGTWWNEPPTGPTNGLEILIMWTWIWITESLRAHPKLLYPEWQHWISCRACKSNRAGCF